MLLFSSEEHVAEWLKLWSLPRVEVLLLDQCWRLALAWYGADRRDSGWRRKTVEEAEGLFTKFGLTSPFWRLR